VPKVHGAKPLAALVRAGGAVEALPIRVGGATPETNVVCRCERVTEAELVDALRRSLPAASTQALRKRTRAGMGYCQGEYCEPRVCEIIARERGGRAADVPRRPWPASSILPKRWMGEADIEDFVSCAGGKPRSA
jgi:glycerol-3-phosphate dehydrogenase